MNSFITIKKLIACYTVLFCAFSLHGQIINGTDTLYGNEWINFDTPDRYFRIDISEDGIYRLNKALLPTEADGVAGNQFQLWHNGEEVPVFVSNENAFGNNDFIEFYATRNRMEIDRHLFQTPDHIFNPEHSLITDTSSYYLTWNSGNNNERYNQETNDITNPPLPETHFIHKELQYFSDRHNKFANGSSVQQSYFDNGQGFGRISTAGSRQNFYFDPIAVSSEETEVVFEYKAVTYSEREHIQRIRLNNKVITADTFYGYDMRSYEIPLTTDQLNTSNNFEVRGMVSGSQDKQIVSYAALSYPREFNFGDTSGFHFSLPASAASKYLEISNFDISDTPILYDLTNKIRIETTVDAGIVKVLLPASSIKRSLLLVNSTTGVTSVNALEKTEFTDFSFSDAEFMILTSKNLVQAGTGISDYANYRSRDYRTTVVEVEQLYEQFAYGLRRHPLAVKNFANFMKKKNSDLKYVLIMGKGREYADIRTPEKLTDGGLIVPTYGFPGSDNILFSNDQSSTPLFAIGRVTAKNNQDILNYLDKVRSTESFSNQPQTIDDKQWPKRIIHLGGGKDTDVALIKSYLTDMENRITESKMGAKVFPFYKSSTDPIQNSRSKEIQTLINGGVGIINFFGHSSASSFDFNIENPKEYSNKDKYFMLISNGCFSGRCHTSSSSIGELFMLEKDKGAVLYYASTGLGGVTAMRDFTGELYDRLGETEYGAGIGDLFVNLINKIDNGNTNNFTLENVLSQQQTLQGDPAIRLYPMEGPDFVVNVEKTSHSPELLNTQLNNFELTVPVSNIGFKVPSNIIVSVVQKNQEGDIIFQESKSINSPGFEETLSFNIPIREEQDIVGLNTFHIRVDSTDLVEELPSPAAELNNEYTNGNDIGYDILISSNDLAPVFPPEFSIVSDKELFLKASTSNPLIESQKFVFQIDTTESFSSPILKTETVSQRGGVVKWQPNLNFKNNTVYYWRTSQSDELTGSYRWSGSSFLYLESGGTGWNQSHYFQFLDNEFDKTTFDDNRQLNYVKDFKDIVVTNGVAFFNPNDNSIWHNPAITINGNPQHGSISFREGDNGIRIYVLDSLSLEPRLVPAGFPAPSVAGRKFFAFETDEYEGRKNAISFLRDSIPKGNFVVFLTYSRNQDSDYRPDLWAADTDSLGTNLFDVLEDKGSLLIRSLENDPKPFGFAYKEGFPGLIEESEFIVQDSTGIIDKSIPLFTAWEEGSVYSVPIGPSKGWDSFSWENENDGVEITFANIHGVRENGSANILKRELQSGNHDLSDIDHTIYPYLQIEFFSSDSTNRTAPQLNYWRIFHEEVPELAVNPTLHFETSGDTVSVGESYDFSIALENISNVAMDSLLIKFTSKDEQNNITITEKRMLPVAAGASVNAEISIPTDQVLGLQSLLLEANPNDDQPELTHINNTAAINFFAAGDARNPLLDVTFDGMHITNGDIVSPEPFIEIVLKDENEFLFVDDTTSFKLFVKKPDSDEPEEIYFDANPEVSFVPASASNKTAKIEYRPKFDADGVYLLKIIASDASGNLSGNDFLVNFKIINKSMISNVLNYPNPFNNRTKFVYTLTGSQPPAFFKLQVLTVSGKIVRELTQNDLGMLRIGTHQTDNFWDGTDEYGEPLANGVYLYRLTAQKSDGSDIERFEEEKIDGFFNKGFGKMVILR